MTGAPCVQTAFTSQPGRAARQLPTCRPRRCAFSTSGAPSRGADVDSAEMGARFPFQLPGSYRAFQLVSVSGSIANVGRHGATGRRSLAIPATRQLRGYRDPLLRSSRRGDRMPGTPYCFPDSLPVD